MYKNLLKTKKRLPSRKIKGNVGEPKKLWKASIPRVAIQDKPSLSSFSQGWRKVFSLMKKQLITPSRIFRLN